MLVIPKPEIKKLHASPRRRDGRPGDLEAGQRALHHVKTLALVLVAGAVSVSAYRLFAGPSSRPDLRPVSVERPQPLIRTGQRITVPEGSPIRTKLAILPVSEQQIQRNLVLPAVVEADPSRWL